MNKLITSKIFKLLQSKQGEPHFDIVEWNQNLYQLKYQLHQSLLEKACNDSETYDVITTAVDSNKNDLTHNLSAYVRIKKAFNHTTLDPYMIKIIAELLDDYVTIYKLIKLQNSDIKFQNMDNVNELYTKQICKKGYHDPHNDFITLLKVFTNVNEGKADFKPTTILTNI